MNIESLLEKIDLFDDAVVESGFMRDVKEYVTTIGQPDTQSNLAALKDIANKVFEKFEQIKESELPEAMDILSPTEETFTDIDTFDELKALIEDPDIDTSTFYSKLNEILTKLRDQIKTDSEKFEELKTTLSIYSKTEVERTAEAGKAILSIVLKDVDTITNLKRFAKTVARWNEALYLYHQLVNGESPKDIELLEVQNGSIDIVFNLDLKVSVDLVQLLDVGLKAFLAYLVYKSKIHEIVAGFAGNAKLIANEKKQEELLLNNVYESLDKTIREQHKDRKRTDKKINSESIDVKVKKVTSLLAEQIIKGNEVKLLAAPKIEEADEEMADLEKPRELREKNARIRKLQKELTSDDIKLLKEKFDLSDDENVL